MSAHPSEYIIEEMIARGWTADDLAARMSVSRDDFPVNRLALDFYCEIGPETPALRIGTCSAEGFARAFGTSPDFYLNLEAAWLTANAGPHP